MIFQTGSHLVKNMELSDAWDLWNLHKSSDRYSKLIIHHLPWKYLAESLDLGTIFEPSPVRLLLLMLHRDHPKTCDFCMK